MYENYVGKAANITLTDGRLVRATITEVLDGAGSMKLSDVRIFKTPNDIPRELVSFTIPGNRIQDVSIEHQESQDSSQIIVDNVDQVPSTVSPLVPDTRPIVTPLDTLLGSPISDMATTPRSLASPMSSNNVSVNDVTSVKVDNPSTPEPKPAAKIPSFASVRPNRDRIFVETIEMEYGDLWDGSTSSASNRSPVVKGKQTPKQRDTSPSSQSQASFITANSPTQQKIDQEQQKQKLTNQGAMAVNQPAINDNISSLGPQNPKIDQNATNLLLANLNIAKVPSSSASVPKSEGPQNNLKKLPHFAIPAGLIPPKARRKESSDSAIPQTPENKKGIHAKAPQPIATPPNETMTKPVESASPQIPTSTIRTVSEGKNCPLVTPSLMRCVHAICDTESGPNNTMIMESAGVSAAMMALKAIGGHRRIQPSNHNAAPLVVVLAGNNNYAGAYGLAAARHLLNRGCQVVVCIAASNNASISQRIASQEYAIQMAGGRIVKCVEDLPQQLTTPVDIIIDALLGSQISFTDLKSDYDSFQIVTAAMEWANSNKAPVLSLDFPSGVDPVEGTPYHVNHRVKPKWTLCYGAPTSGCASRNVTGELFVADIGIPAMAWKKANVNPIVPFGQDIIIALEYSHV
ncbi:YjeF N-terminal domain-containing protein [Umbelopsis sp. PMI_123]|nr:YjeF N-terminal domain-containing protein [Umbelopsis sp. PMI_123]